MVEAIVDTYDSRKFDCLGDVVRANDRDAELNKGASRSWTFD